MCVIRHLKCKMWIRCFFSWLQASVLVIKKTAGFWTHGEMRLVRWSIIYYHTSASTEWQMPITEIGLQRSMLLWWPQPQLQRLEWFYTHSHSLQGQRQTHTHKQKSSVFWAWIWWKNQNSSVHVHYICGTINTVSWHWSLMFSAGYSLDSFLFRGSSHRMHICFLFVILVFVFS